MSSNFHNGEFENSIPALSLDDARVIIVNDFALIEFIYKNINLMYYIKDNIGKLVYHIDAVGYDQAYRYLI